METSTEVCWSTKEPFKGTVTVSTADVSMSVAGSANGSVQITSYFLMPKSRSPERDLAAEHDTTLIKSLPYTGLCSITKRRNAKRKPKKQNSNTSFPSSSEKLPTSASVVGPSTPPNRPPTPPKASPTPPKGSATSLKKPSTPPKASPMKANKPQVPQDTASAVCSNADCTSQPQKPKKIKSPKKPPTSAKASPVKANKTQVPKDTVTPASSNGDSASQPKPKKLKKVKQVKKPPYPVSCGCHPDTKVEEKKKTNKDDAKRCNSKYCPSCFTDRCECGRPKRIKIKGKRSKPSVSMSVLKENAKSNCCACCCLLADYFKEVYRLITLKNDSRISQILCEIYDVAGCLCNDCLVFLKKILGGLKGS